MPEPFAHAILNPHPTCPIPEVVSTIIASWARIQTLMTSYGESVEAPIEEAAAAFRELLAHVVGELSMPPAAAQQEADVVKPNTHFARMRMETLASRGSWSD